MRSAEDALALVEKMASIYPFSPQIIWSATNVSISPGSNKYVGQEALVPVQIIVLKTGPVHWLDQKTGTGNLAGLLSALDQSRH
jgi:hypothetical protein